MRKLRRWFWFEALDLVVFCGGLGTRAYLYCVERAARTVDWGDFNPRAVEHDDAP